MLIVLFLTLKLVHNKIKLKKKNLQDVKLFVIDKSTKQPIMGL